MATDYAPLSALADRDEDMLIDDTPVADNASTQPKQYIFKPYNPKTKLSPLSNQMNLPEPIVNGKQMIFELSNQGLGNPIAQAVTTTTSPPRLLIPNPKLNRRKRTPGRLRKKNAKVEGELGVLDSRNEARIDANAIIMGLSRMAHLDTRNEGGSNTNTLTLPFHTRAPPPTPTSTSPPPPNTITDPTTKSYKRPRPITCDCGRSFTSQLSKNDHVDRGNHFTLMAKNVRLGRIFFDTPMKKSTAVMKHKGLTKGEKRRANAARRDMRETLKRSLGKSEKVRERVIKKAVGEVEMLFGGMDWGLGGRGDGGKGKGDGGGADGGGAMSSTSPYEVWARHWPKKRARQFERSSAEKKEIEIICEEYQTRRSARLARIAKLEDVKVKNEDVEWERKEEMKCSSLRVELPVRVKLEEAACATLTLPIRVKRESSDEDEVCISEKRIKLESGLELPLR
ncbi:hypothetical protein EJ08DRAFT_691438 [Tothia fuscella]|uniref:Uncharacterized protein n=1 Tax=Tothia fuscella TaxID=1048955 RepID=A0A9P4U5I4_9PEZI|nr:hypothetical protein EJ08DRAFT_691438 [Tothia fuscella]